MAADINLEPESVFKKLPKKVRMTTAQKNDQMENSVLWVTLF